MTDAILAGKLDIHKNACIEIFGLNLRLTNTSGFEISQST